MRARQKGFSYVVALFALAASAVLAQRVLQSTLSAERREREAELLYVGQAYREAIRQYYEQTPGSAKFYPPNLEALLLDTRSVRIRRPLRRLYPDPVAQSAQWGLVRAPDGGIMGVHSLSTGVPIKTANFPVSLQTFANAKSYGEWQFVHVAVPTP